MTMTDLQKDLLERVTTLEANIATYAKFTEDTSNPEDDRKIVGFKLFYDMVSFSTLLAHVPDYNPTPGTTMMLIQGFRGVNDYVNIVDGKIEISPEYREMLKMKEMYLKNKN